MPSYPYRRYRHLPMPQPFTRLALVVCTAAGLSCLAAAPVRAERADRELPLEIDAGQVRIDGKRKLRMLSGGVEIRRGSLIIRAQQIELRETPEGDVAVAQGSPSAPASFRQKRDGVDELIEGQAVRIGYDSGNETVRLDQGAQLKRWMGSRLAEDLSGQVIVYDHARDTFEVNGNTPAAGGGTETPGRVRVVVAPRSGPAAAAVRSSPPALLPARPAASAPARAAETR